MRVLVTGGAGYIGSHMVKALGERGYDVLTYDNLSSGNAEAVLYGDLVVGYLSDSVLLTKTVGDYRPEAVLHFAVEFMWNGESIATAVVPAEGVVTFNRYPTARGYVRVHLTRSDGTLLAVKSAKLWLRREWRYRRITAWQGVRAIGFLAAYRMGIADIENATREALRTVRGLTEDEVRRWFEEWFDEDVASHAAPGSWPTIEAHRASGHSLVLLTSASPYEAARAAALFGLDAWISSKYEVVDARFTGEPVVPLCYGWAWEISGVPKGASRG